MNPGRLRGLLRALFRRRAQQHDLDREIRFHVDMLVQENIQAGMSPDEARLAAEREFGGSDQYREACRDAWRPPTLDLVLADMRCAVHSLRRSPGFAVLAVVTLALGIGANTAMFSLVNSVLFEPPPYPDSDQLDQIYRATEQAPEGQISVADYLDLLPHVTDYGQIGAYAYADLSLAQSDRSPEIASGLRVSANFLDVLRVTPQLGRGFRPEEEIQGNDRRVILSERCWLARFGGEPEIVGRTIRVNGEPREVVGVLRGSFNDWRHIGWADVLIPLALETDERTNRADPSLSLLGRRRADHPAHDPSASLVAFGERMAAEHPEVNDGARWRVVPLRQVLIGESGAVVLLMLVGLSAFVLLIACSNLANFLLARTMARAREFAVRAALGASRLQLLRPLAIESLLIALTGGAGAILVARSFADWLAHRSTGDNGESVALVLNWPVFAWALIASLFTALAFGLGPALFAFRLNLNGTLKSGGRGAVGSRGQQRFRHLLIVGQFALALVLLTGAGLFIRGLADLNNRRTGWSSEGLVTGSILLPQGDYPDASSIAAFQRLAVERLAALPGAESASLSFYLPFLTWHETRKFAIDGQLAPERGREPAALVNGASPDYFKTVNTRVLAGRAFTDRDTATSTPVAIISASMAKALFGADTAVGRRIAQAGTQDVSWCEIVGVVGDVQSIFPDPTPVTHQLYRPVAQEPRARLEIAVRTDPAAASTLVSGIRAAIAGIDPDLPVRKLTSADARIYRENYQLAVLREMLTAFAILGLALASVGIYGVIARLMAQRTVEFGIRIALGAQVHEIVRLVLGSGVRLALMGAAIGFLGAIGVSRLLAAAFPNMRLDPGLALVGAALLLVAVALVACYLPARRASRISPIAALRAD